jgi:hypothetical protein
MEPLGLKDNDLASCDMWMDHSSQVDLLEQALMELGAIKEFLVVMILDGIRCRRICIGETRRNSSMLTAYQTLIQFCS